jgi:hypothetical protein
MMTDQDRQWLAGSWPGLTVNDGSISGALEFAATYNNQTNEFLILGSGVPDTVGGRCLAGHFDVCIKERKDASISALPALFVGGLNAIPDRHFNPTDTSACLCSPFEEQEFLTPALDFRRYFEQLIIPFLYGQVFYSAEGHWPWFEYGHGAIGLLESYSRIGDKGKAQECVLKLARDKDAWPRIRRALKSREAVKGATPCFCAVADHIRRCHPLAWRGIRQLKDDLSAQGLSIS